MSKTIKEIITEEFLTCNICMEIFQNPKILKCLHTFCEKCILSTIQHQRLNAEHNTEENISCPICRTRIETAPHEALELQTNYPVKNLLDMVQGSSNNECFKELYRVKAGLNLDRTQAVAIAEKSQCRYLESSNDELRRAVIDLRRELTEEKNTCYELEQNIYELQGVISDLRREISEERKRGSYLQSSNTALQASTSDIGKQLTQEKKRNSDLQVENNTLQAEIVNLQKLQAEYEKQLINEREENVNLKEELAEMNQTVDHLRKYEKQLINEREENVNLKEELAEMNQTVDHLRKVQKDLEEVVDKQKNMSFFSWMGNQFKMSVSWLPVWFKCKQEGNKTKHH